jgi:hypothetical protein
MKEPYINSFIQQKLKIDGLSPSDTKYPAMYGSMKKEFRHALGY